MKHSLLQSYLNISVGLTFLISVSLIIGYVSHQAEEDQTYSQCLAAQHDVATLSGLTRELQCRIKTLPYLPEECEATITLQQMLGTPSGQPLDNPCINRCLEASTLEKTFGACRPPLRFWLEVMRHRAALLSGP